MKIHWVTYPSVSNGDRDANRLSVKALGLPYHKGSGRLAVVGGGNSINDHIEELKAYNGNVWAVNGTINWCIDNGVDAAFYTIDAAKMANWYYSLDRVKRAYLADDCSPELIAFLQSKGADVQLLSTPDGGPTSAAASDLLSLQAGYTHVTFYGCEGNFGDTTHAFDSFPVADWIDVDIDGQRFRTKPEFCQQSQIISEVIRELPQAYAEKSGGLLRVMVEHGPDYDVYQVSNELFAKLKDREEAA